MRHGEITEEFYDGEHVFWMPYGGLQELQDKRNCGAIAVLMRLSEDNWMVEDVRETIRIALVHGGGVKAPEAAKLVDRNFAVSPWIDGRMLAWRILHAVLVLPREEAQKKSVAAGMPAKPTESTSEISMATVQ